MRISSLLILLLLAGGCTKYEFDLTDPPDLATHIARNKETILKRDELEYRMQAVENRLLMHVVNPTDDPIELMGPQSTAVDPTGQSHPFRSQTIAPHSFVKLILPPMPVYYRTGPTFGIGVGIHAYRDPYPYGPAFEDPTMWDRPTYFAVVDESETFFWEWEGEGEARIRLTFRRGREEFHHNFVFRRKKE
jgi:hypothetical protein